VLNGPVPVARRRPFAYSVTKIDRLVAICPTLPLAITAARGGVDRLALPPVITAWFPDGSWDVIPQELLSNAENFISVWISPEEAAVLEKSRYGGEGVEADRAQDA
jgi:hypothetical protein